MRKISLLRELNMSVGTGDGSAYLGRHGKGNLIDADSAFSRNTQYGYPENYFDYLEEDSEELFLESDDSLDKLGRAARSAKSTGILGKMPFLKNLMSGVKIGGAVVPGIDIALLATFVLSASKQITEFEYNFNTEMRLDPGSQLVEYLEDASEDQFREFKIYLVRFFEANPEIAAQLKDDFNDILQVIKDVITSLILVAEPLAAAAAGSVVPFLGTAAGYLTGKAAGVATAIAIHMIPFERLLFELSGKYAEGLQKAMSIFKSKAREEGQDLGEINEHSLFISFFTSPIQTFSRMGQIYDLLHQGQESETYKLIKQLGKTNLAERSIISKRVFRKNKYMLIETLENIEEDYASNANAMNRKLVSSARDRKNMSLDEEELDEMSIAGGIGGFSLPLGQKPKNFNKKNKK